MEKAYFKSCLEYIFIHEVMAHCIPYLKERIRAKPIANMRSERESDKEEQRRIVLGL